MHTLSQLKENAFASLPMYHPDLLRSFFCKGYTKQVIQVLQELYAHLSDPENCPLPMLSKIDFAEEKPAPKPQQKAFNAFADFDDSDSDDDQPAASQNKKGEEEPEKDYVIQFMEIVDDLQEKICSKNCDLDLTSYEKLTMVQFLHKLKPFIKTDFYCDKMSTHLLMKVHLETEKVPQSELVNA